eukprot:6529214-Pyramimonas_sp.AAC.1
MQSFEKDILDLKAFYKAAVEQDLLSMAGNLEAKVPVHSSAAILGNTDQMDAVMDADHAAMTSVSMILKGVMK